MVIDWGGLVAGELGRSVGCGLSEMWSWYYWLKEY